jgi:hypothetical protein
MDSERIKVGINCVAPLGLIDRAILEIHIGLGLPSSHRANPMQKVAFLCYIFSRV